MGSARCPALYEERLKERLFVIRADAICPHQFGGDPAEAAREDEAARSRIAAPEVADLKERFPIGVAVIGPPLF